MVAVGSPPARPGRGQEELASTSCASAAADRKQRPAKVIGPYILFWNRRINRTRSSCFWLLSINASQKPGHSPPSPGLHSRRREQFHDHSGASCGRRTDQRFRTLGLRLGQRQRCRVPTPKACLRRGMSLVRNCSFRTGASARCTTGGQHCTESVHYRRGRPKADGNDYLRGLASRTRARRAQLRPTLDVVAISLWPPHT
jgi:hypothetical protein